MFGAVNTELPTRLICDFDAALRKWESIRPIRGRSDQNTRPLARRQNDNLTIRVDNPENPCGVYVRLYGTDIVTYAPGYIRLEPYPTALTSRVVSSLLPPSQVYPHWSHRTYPRPDHVTYVQGKFYHTPHEVLLRNEDGQLPLVRGSVPFKVPKVDRKAANALLKELRFSEFAVWLRALCRLNPGIVETKRRKYYPNGRYDPSSVRASSMTVRQCLCAGPEGWARLVDIWVVSDGDTVDKFIETVRTTAYRDTEVVMPDEVPYVHSHRELQNMFASMARWT